MSEWSEHNLRRIVFALPENGLPFDRLRDLGQRMLYPEQRRNFFGPWPEDAMRSGLRELVKQRRVTFTNGRYYRTASRVPVPRMLRLPIDQFEPLWPEVAAEAWYA